MSFITLTLAELEERAKSYAQKLISTDPEVIPAVLRAKFTTVEAYQKAIEPKAKVVNELIAIHKRIAELDTRTKLESELDAMFSESPDSISLNTFRFIQVLRLYPRQYAIYERWDTIRG